MQGLNNSEVEKAQELYGKCAVSIHVPGLFEFLFKTLCNPINIVVYIPATLWMIEKLYSSGIINYVVLVILIIILYILTKISKIKLVKYAKSPQKTIQVIRNGEKTTSDTVNIVPGDVIIIEKNMNMPCDAIVIQGEVLMDENTITGEIDPICKVEVENSDQKFNYSSNYTNILYEGTTVLNINWQT